MYELPNLVQYMVLRQEQIYLSDPANILLVCHPSCNASSTHLGEFTLGDKLLLLPGTWLFADTFGWKKIYQEHEAIC